MPRGFVHHYDVNIQPDKCPRKVNNPRVTHTYNNTYSALKTSWNQCFLYSR